MKEESSNINDYLICFNGSYYSIDRATSNIIFISNKRKGMAGLYRHQIKKKDLIRKSVNVLDLKIVRCT